MKELIVCNRNNRKIIGLVEEEELVELYEEDSNNRSIEGNIYIGKVQNVILGLQSAFVNIGEKRNAFIHVKDVLPKLDITKQEKGEYPPISSLVKSGMPIIVEVKKEAVDKKGPRLSTHITITSRLIVYMPNSEFVTISQKIENEKERKRLKDIVEKHLPEGTGAIIRTTAEGKSEEEIKKDIDYIVEKWDRIQEKDVDVVPKLIYDKGGILRKTIVDLVDAKLDRIVVQNKEDYEKIKEIEEEIGVDVEIELDENIFERNNLEKQIKNAVNQKVWLENGGFINIDKTEALIAIDVNSGKYIGKKDVEQTITQVNLEAAREIAKQIRLRDISGIIVIDFIDMQKQEDKDKIIAEMKMAIKKDRSKVQIEDFTKLNLMEITRKHINSKKFD
ncbi:MAG: Rne/Rng family ribonuclease [Clostridia bacterium]|nr:Rne/Rng family ribonuclease [Clostridia bacterium]